MYQIKYENFEGPLDLLLELFEKKKLDITKLSLAKVADDYLEYIESNKNVNLATLSDFLLTASQLILIKSKALLPLFQFTSEEEEEIEDLQARLKEYQKFKKASEDLRAKLSGEAKAFSKNEELFIGRKFVAPKINCQELAKIFKQVEMELPKEERLEKELMQEVVSLEDKMMQIRKSLEGRMKLAFTETINNAQDKMEVIVSFLAMLEMIKQKIINVGQEALFTQIRISKRAR